MSSKIKRQIAHLEERLEEFKNNKEVAEEHGELRRAHKYENRIRDTKRKIHELEKEIPTESNKRLREIIDELKDNNEELRKQIIDLREEIKEQNQRIDRFVNPEKYEKEEEEEPEVEMKECPWCHREFKGTKGLKIHQRSCKQGEAIGHNLN
jgi:chromosome segregation ATPase